MNQWLVGCHTPGCDTDTGRTATLPAESGYRPEGVSQPPRDTPVTAIRPSLFLYPEVFEGWGRGVTGVTGGQQPIAYARVCAHTRTHACTPGDRSLDTRDTRDTPRLTGGEKTHQTLSRPNCRHGCRGGGVVTPRDPPLAVTAVQGGETP